MPSLRKVIYWIIRIGLLALIVVLGVTAFFPAWYDQRQVLIDEVRMRFMSKEEIIQLHEARERGISLSAYRNQLSAAHQQQQRREQAIRELTNALQQNDEAQLRSALNSLQQNGAPDHLYTLAIDYQQPAAMRVMQQAQIPCAYNTLSGFNAFNRAIASNDLRYFGLLIDMGCDTQAADGVQAMVPQLVNAQKFDHLALLPHTAEIDRARRTALVSAIEHGQTITIIGLLNAGVNPQDDPQIDGPLLLMHSINQGLTAVASTLIEQGVDYGPYQPQRDVLVDEDKTQPAATAAFYPLVAALETHQLPVAEAILQRDPEVIRREQLSGPVLEIATNAATPNYTQELLHLLEAYPPDYNALPDGGVNEFAHAVRTGNWLVIQHLLTQLPQLSFEPFTADQLSALDRTLRNTPLDKTGLSVLLEKQLDLQQFQHQGRDQLVAAIQQGDIEAVEYLLDQGVNPNRLYHLNTVLGIAQASLHPHREQVISLLEQRGTSADIHAIARAERGIDPAAQCHIGTTISIADADNLRTKLQGYLAETGKTMDLVEVCEATLLNCISQQYNLDDCFYSVPDCNTDTAETPVSSTTTVALCCPSSIKQQYQQNRCAGFTEEEAVTLIDSLNTINTVPIILLNNTNDKNDTPRDTIAPGH